MKFKEMCEELEAIIQTAYTEGFTLAENEKLAARFLHAQLSVSAELKIASLDARMRKSGVKAIRAATYMGICAGSDKKPTENMIESMINTTGEVNVEQIALDQAESEAEDLKRYYDIFANAHIFFRGCAKGNFGG